MKMGYILQWTSSMYECDKYGMKDWGNQQITVSDCDVYQLGYKIGEQGRKAV